MSEIPTIQSRVSEDKGMRVTVAPVRAEWIHDGQRYAVQVPPGFRYKPGISLRLGSLGLLDIFAPTYSLEDVSCVHDYCYRHRTDMPRAAADEVMRLDDGDPDWVGQVAWGLVRVFGWTVW